MDMTARRIRTALLASAVLLVASCGGTSTEERPGASPETSGRPDSTTRSTTPPITSVAPSTAGSTNPAPSGLVDPLPDAAAAESVTCDGCPVITGIDDLRPDVGAATTLSVTGTVASAAGDGVFHVVTPSGQSLGGAIPTETDGSFEVTVPLFCGEQLVKLAWRNPAGTAGVVLAPITEACRGTSLRVTLTWDAAGDDFELHLVRAGGLINDRTDDGSGSNDCTWTTCIRSSPDWGVIGDPSDDPLKDIDDTGSYGPENITLSNPEPIVYTVLVEHWGKGAPDADGEVIINVGGREPVSVPITDLAPRWVAVVATVEFPGGTITPIGEQYDCRADWGRNGGCGAAIPS